MTAHEIWFPDDTDTRDAPLEGCRLADILPDDELRPLPSGFAVEWAWALVRTVDPEGVGWSVRTSAPPDYDELVEALSHHHEILMERAVESWLDDEMLVPDISSGPVHTGRVRPAALVGHLSVDPLEDGHSPTAAILLMKLLSPNNSRAWELRCLGPIEEEEVIGALSIQISAGTRRLYSGWTADEGSPG